MQRDIYIKHMVCNRCIMVVEKELTELDLGPFFIKLGKISFERELTPIEVKLIKDRIEPLGFEVLDDKKRRLVEQIKTIIIDVICIEEHDKKPNLSEVLADKLAHDYYYLSTLFSEVEGITIEKYYINQKIEKVKELLVYEGISLSEIAFKLNYSSVAYLSNQFKKITGFTPIHFKKIRADKEDVKQVLKPRN